MSEVSDKFSALSISAAPAAPLLEKATKGAVRRVITNSIKITLKPNLPFFLHDFRAHAVFERNGADKLKELTKQTRDDFTEQVRKEATLRAFNALKNQNVLTGDFITDRAALLISLDEIPQCKGGAEFTHILTAQTAPLLFELETIREAREVRCTIKKAETYQVSTNDINSKDAAAQLALINVINLGTSQGLFENTFEFIVYSTGNAYLLHPERFGLRNFDVGTRDKYGSVGLTKGARLVGETNGIAAAALTVEVKRGVFHVDFQIVLEKMRAMGCEQNPLEATRLLRGIKCHVHYEGARNRRRHDIVIGSVLNIRVRDAAFTLDTGERCKMADYVRRKYNTNLLSLDSFVVSDKHKGNLYSPECLMVAPNQRVKTEHMQKRNQERSIAESATLPPRRLAETRDMAAAVDVDRENEAQERRGITADATRLMRADAHTLASITLGTAGTPITAKGPWKQGSVAQSPSFLKRWTAVNIKTRPDNLVGIQKVVDELCAQCAANGFKLGEIPFSTVTAEIEANHEAQLDKIFSSAKTDGSQFILIVTDRNTKNHAVIKQLEIKHDIITQQITSFVAGMICSGKRNTTSNVTLKLIEKVGGQNNFVCRSTSDLPAWLTKRGTMIAGLQLQHPSSMSQKDKEEGVLPSCPVYIGFSSNAVKGAKSKGISDAQLEKEATHFSSDWMYGMPKDYQNGEQYAQSYTNAVVRMLRAFKLYRDTVPARIILYRGGVAEGDYDKIRKDEVRMWHEAFKRLSSTYNPTFIIVSVNQMHSDRFYLETVPAGATRVQDQNLPSGTYIDSGVTNPLLSQAYIQSHVPLKGTAKVPSYVVQHMFLNPMMKMNVTMDDIIRISHALCFTHGVCNTPTSIPTPLFIARESMKRAMELFVHHTRGTGATWTIDSLNEKLAMSTKSDIYGLRVNA